MKSGLEDQNNATVNPAGSDQGPVSMKSGLEDRNNKSGKPCRLVPSASQ